MFFCELPEKHPKRVQNFVFGSDSGSECDNPTSDQKYNPDIEICPPNTPEDARIISNPTNYGQRTINTLKSCKLK